MNDEQKKALNRLAAPFRLCKKAKVVFQGMDHALSAWDASEYWELTKDTSICDQQYIRGGNQGYPVETHGTYIDSGGW